MSIISIISNCSERLFSYHWNFTICLLVNFFIIIIPMDCGTLMSTKKDWYREGGKSCIHYFYFSIMTVMLWKVNQSNPHIPYDDNLFFSCLSLSLPTFCLWAWSVVCTASCSTGCGRLSAPGVTHHLLRQSRTRSGSSSSAYQVCSLTQFYSCLLL